MPSCLGGESPFLTKTKKGSTVSTEFSIDQAQKGLKLVEKVKQLRRYSLEEREIVKVNSIESAGRSHCEGPSAAGEATKR